LTTEWKRRVEKKRVHVRRMRTRLLGWAEVGDGVFRCCRMNVQRGGLVKRRGRRDGVAVLGARGKAV